MSVGFAVVLYKFFSMLSCPKSKRLCAEFAAVLYKQILLNVKLPSSKTRTRAKEKVVQAWPPRKNVAFFIIIVAFGSVGSFQDCCHEMTLAEVNLRADRLHQPALGSQGLFPGLRVWHEARPAQCQPQPSLTHFSFCSRIGAKSRLWSYPLFLLQ